MLKAEKTQSKGQKSAQNSGVFKKVMMAFLGVISFVILLIIIANVIAIFAGVTPNGVGQQGGAGKAGIIQDGVPQSADDFLRSQ